MDLTFDVYKEFNCTQFNRQLKVILAIEEVKKKLTNLQQNEANVTVIVDNDERKAVDKISTLLGIF
jgi:hypothetical protein